MAYFLIVLLLTAYVNHSETTEVCLYLVALLYKKFINLMVLETV